MRLDKREKEILAHALDALYIDVDLKLVTPVLEMTKEQVLGEAKRRKYLKRILNLKAKFKDAIP